MNLKQILLKKNNPHWYWMDDIFRIINIMNKNGYQCSVDDATGLWEEGSKEYLVKNWVSDFNNENLMSALRKYFIVPGIYNE